jgi:hypothetical protein
LTPEQLFEHRLASLLGRSLSEIDELPVQELERWAKYWSEEPWGAYRDNLHAALIVSELLKPHLERGAKLSLLDFMFEHPEDRKKRSRAKLLTTLNALAKPEK